jgi:hypothetical protein
MSKDADCSWVDQLYLLPALVGRGIGTRLLELARSTLVPPIRLYTFQCNQPARIFYERRGFEAIAFGDGSGNEERCPDILYEWQPRTSREPAGADPPGPALPAGPDFR